MSAPENLRSVESITQMATRMSVPAHKVWNAIKGLKLEPDMRYGTCNVYGRDAIVKIEAEMKRRRNYRRHGVEVATA